MAGQKLGATEITLVGNFVQVRAAKRIPGRGRHRAELVAVEALGCDLMGGQPPLDPSSDADDTQTEATERLKGDTAAQTDLAHTIALSAVSADGFDPVLYPGGHGPIWDLVEDADSIKLIETFARTNRPIAAVCHAPAVVKHPKGADGKPLVFGKTVTEFNNTE